MKATDYNVGALYEVIYTPELIYGAPIPFLILATLQQVKNYYLDDGCFTGDYEELKHGDMVVFLCEPITASTNGKFWGYVQLLTQNGYVGWTLFNENDFKKIEK